MRSILLTCGVGDFVAMDSFLTRAERMTVNEIHWATRARETVAQLVPHVFPYARRFHVERDTWGAPFTKDFCISSRDQLPGLSPRVFDLSISKVADGVRNGARTYQGSRFVGRPVANIPRSIALPPRYMVVHPYSINAPTPQRDLSPAEWQAVQRYAASLDLPIVVLNKGDRPFSGERVLDLSNRTTILEGFEIVRRAAAFAGCSSVFSVVASKVLPFNKLFIKGHDVLRRSYYWLYYAPCEVNSFIASDLRRIVPT